MKRATAVTPIARQAAIVPVFNAIPVEEFWRQEHLLPEQFFTSAQESHDRWTGERLLMLAVLQEAVHTYLRYCSSETRRGRRLYDETRTWFLSHERHYLYTFENVCDHLSLDSDYIRQGLEKWPRSTESRPNPLRTVYKRVAPTNKQRTFTQAA
jgi:hypothetical protein